ncbi:hypothetical protein CEXT_261541 [Caerostris extrusa]|uniref:Uncharacterized protein n=1 Tax=Caerostris extrusa TaxID=172846 RepID=A0AAV4SLG7_CAEEX|nr:hypothetical protein CEXT_261541 [Caerostris extrusa]
MPPPGYISVDTLPQVSECSSFTPDCRFFPRKGPKEVVPCHGPLRKAVSDSDNGLFERDVTLLATPFSPPGPQTPSWSTCAMP